MTGPLNECNSVIHTSNRYDWEASQKPQSTLSVLYPFPETIHEFL